MPSRARLRWTCLALALLASPARAAPPPPTPEHDQSQGDDRSAHVIPPGREGPAAELLAAVVRDTAAPLSWRGPSIEFDRIKWWLEHDGQARGMLLLVPREFAEPDDATSQSFAIRTAWAPDHEPQPHELALMQQAVAAVQAGDRGQFYTVRFDLFEGDGQLPPPYVVAPERDPAKVHKPWALELAGLALLGLLGLGVTLRRRSNSTGATAT